MDDTKSFTILFSKNSITKFATITEIEPIATPKIC